MTIVVGGSVDVATAGWDTLCPGVGLVVGVAVAGALALVARVDDVGVDAAVVVAVGGVDVAVGLGVTLGVDVPVSVGSGLCSVGVGVVVAG